MNLRHRLAAIASTAALLTAIPVVAQADPTQNDPFTLDCGDAGMIEITTNNGNGAWTPGFLVENNNVIIPLSFNFTGTVDGEVVLSETDGKGNANPNRETIECSFYEETVTITDPADESGLPVGTVVTFKGSVTGFLTGKPA